MRTLQHRRRVSLPLLGLACAGGLGAPALADAAFPAERSERSGDIVSVFSDDIDVPADVRQHGNVLCVGSDVRIAGEVTGDVVVILGDLDNRGTIGGGVVGVLAEQRHTDAHIEGELVNVLGSTDLQNTRVSRELVSIFGKFERDALSSFPSLDLGRFSRWLPSLGAILLWWRGLRLLGVFLLLLLLAALVPDRIRVVSEEAPVRYALAFFVGLAGYLGLLIVCSLLLVTVVGLPLAIVGFMVLKWLGIAGVFHAVGRGLGRSLGREMSLLGAILLGFGLYALLTLAPTPLGLSGIVLSLVLAAAFFFLVEVPALGLVLLTRGGGKASSGAVIAPRVPSPPPAAPASPA